MPDTYAVEPRTVLGKKVAVLRREGTIPANIYGRGLESVAVQMPWAQARIMLNAHGRNTLIEVKLDSESAARPVVVRDIGRDPVSGAVSPLFDAPVYGQPHRLFALDDDTFLVHVLLADGDDSWLRITRDGDLADLAISTGTEPSRADVLPSPDGSLLAVTRCTPPAEAHRPAACAVSFVDAFTGALVEPESKVDLPWTVDTRWTTTRRRTDGPWTWTADGRFLLTDWSRAAIALGPGSQPVSTEVPDCFGPRTASSRVAIDGTVARWVDGALVLSTTLEEGIGTFGCWD